MFVFSNLLFQNILFIPCIIELAVNGIRFYNFITKDNKRENIKLKLIKYTFSLFIVLFLLICSSLIEVYISNNILLLFIKYI